jgi:DNA-binding XRE family transcriptional regulator
MENSELVIDQSQTTVTKFDLEQLVEVTVGSEPPPSEPPLYKNNKHFTPAATTAPMVSSLRAQLRKDRWQKDSSGLAYLLHHDKDKPNNIIEHYITSPGDVTILPWDEALQIIDKFGLTTAKLHLIFAAYTMKQEKPWSSQFTLKISDLIEEIGWDKTHKYSIPDKIKSVAMAAFALDCLIVKATWVEGPHKKGGILASVETSRMWNVRVQLFGQQNLESKIEQPEEGYITVRPGLWTESFLNKAGSKAREALYQFGYLAQDILKIDHYHDELALRLGLHLTVESRFHTSGTYQVQTLLEALLPKAIIDTAREDRDKAFKLVNRWNHALEVLMGLERAFQIEFNSLTYPKNLRPDSKARKPRGYFQKLLAAQITIHPPTPFPKVLERKRTTIQKTTLAKLKPGQPHLLTGTQIREARMAKDWTQAKLAGLLGVSQRYISMLEKNERTPKPKQISVLKKILELE